MKNIRFSGTAFLAGLVWGALLLGSIQVVSAAVTSITVSGSDTLSAICAKLATPVTPPPVTPPVVTPPVTPPVSSGEVRLQMYTTSWGAKDNTPPGSNVQFDGTHSGGTGTYADPISLASGYILSAGNPVFDYPLGTMFYSPNLQKYFHVTDECGGDNGANPANTPCHKSDMPPYPQVDMWAGNSNANGILSCEDAVTGVHLMIEHPSATYKVSAGAIYNGSCAQQFGDTVVSS
jgi:hypothetical protein